MNKAKEAKILKVDTYVSEKENEIMDLLEKGKMNLLVAPTGSGKTKFFLNMATNKKIGFLSPFTSVNEQVSSELGDLATIQTGVKETDMVRFDNKSTITTFHSANKLLEMPQIDFLIIDEIHQLINYTGYTRGMIKQFGITLDKLMQKHPEMIVVALTGTPQFITQYSLWEFNEIIIKTKINMLDKIGTIQIQSSIAKYLKEDKKMLFLYSSKKQGEKQATNYNADFICSQNKELNDSYYEITSKGKFLSNKQKVFTSTLLATGVSITDDLEYLITSWSDIVDIIQFISRVRTKVDKAIIQSTYFFHFKFIEEKFGWEGMKWEDDFSGDLESDLKKIKELQDYVSFLLHTNPDTAFLQSTVDKMLSRPEEPIFEVYDGEVILSSF